MTAANNSSLLQVGLGNILSLLWLVPIVGLGYLLYYLMLPTLAFGFSGAYIILLLCGVAILFISAKMHQVLLGVFGGLFLAIGIIGTVIMPIPTTWAIFHADEYHELLGEFEPSTFSEDISPVDPSQIRIVDEEVAKRVGDKLLGSDPALGSRARIGEFRIQQVRGELFWVAPIEHDGFGKWWNHDSTPGYVMVSATNDRDVEYITQVDGRAINIRYQPSAYFGDNLRRHLRFNGYASTGITDFTFEIDDEGNPFWVVTVYEKTIGYSGGEATGVLVVDPESGEFLEYDIDQAPAWIDRIQPESIVRDQINDWGSYGKGWLNSWWGKTGVLKATTGTSLVYGDDGNSYWYTGISSSGSDDSTVGFMLVNTRTKEVHWYQQTGATETAAQGSAEGEVQEKGYDASFPVLYNVVGIPTYVMALKDDAGLIKSIAMVSVEDFSVVGVGTTLQDTLRAYRSRLASRGNALSPDSTVEGFTITDTVARFASDVTGGQTYYYITLESVSDKMFITSSTVSPEVPITQVGDTVLISFSDGGSGVIDLDSFDNVGVQLTVTDDQLAVEARFDRAVQSQETDRDLQSAEQQFDELSEEDRLRLLELLESERE